MRAAILAPSGAAERKGRRRAALLLEVVIALTILVAAMGVLGAQLASGLQMITYSEDQLRVAELTERILNFVELDPETQQRVAEGGELGTEDKFGDEAPGYFWRVRVEPADRDNEEYADLNLVTVEVLHQKDPELVESIDGAEVVRHIAYLKAKPASVNLESLGLDQLGTLDPNGQGGLDGLGLPDELTALIPQLEALLSGYAGGDIPIQQLMSQIDEAQLATLLPLIQSLLENNGAGLEGLSGLAGQLQGGDLAGLLQGGVGGGAPGGGGPGAGPGGRRGGALGRLPGAGRGGESGLPGGGPEGDGPGGRGAGRGGDAGMGPPGGGAGGGPGGRGPGGGPGGRGPGRGGNPGGGMTIEDLIRIRDEMRAQEGGG